MFFASDSKTDALTGKSCGLTNTPLHLNITGGFYIHECFPLQSNCKPVTVCNKEVYLSGEIPLFC